MGQRPPRPTPRAVPPRKLDDQADSELVELVREGNTHAFGTLWKRHAGPGKAVARAYSASLDADDLVAESFTKIFQSIQSGKGPTTAFRAYLFTTIRNTASSWGRSSRESPTDALDDLAGPTSLEDESLAALDRSLTATAFRSLPTRWQEALWYSEVEGLTAQQIAPLLGMKANAVYALAFRAREGLRQAWIQAHISSVPEDSDCRWSIDRLGGHARGALASRDQTRLDDHLAECNRCAIIASEAQEIGSRLALILLPLVAGVGGAAAYTAWSQTGEASSLLAALEPVGQPPAVVSASFTKPSKSLSTGATIALVALAVGLVGGGAVIVPTLMSSEPGEQNIAQPHDPALSPADEADAAVPEIMSPDLVPDLAPGLAPVPGSPPPVPSEVRPDSSPAPSEPTPEPSTVPSPSPSPTSTPKPSPTPTPTPTPTSPPIVTPPVPEVTSPTAGVDVRTATVTVSGAGKPGNTVQIVVAKPFAGAPLEVPVDANGQWSTTVGPLANGTYSLTITQRTRAGMASKPVVRSITVDILEAPTSTMTPDPGERFVPSLTGQAEPGATVEVLNAAGVVIDRAAADATTGAWTIDAVNGLGFGQQSLGVRQRDRAGNVSASAVIGTLNLKLIEITLPHDGAEVGSSADVTVVGDPGQAFEALVDGVPTRNRHSILSNGTWTGRLTTPPALGSHTLSVRYADREVGATRFGPEYTITFVVVAPADAPPSGSSPLDPLVID